MFKSHLKVTSHLEIPYEHQVRTDASHRCECLNVTLLATTFPTTSHENRQFIQSVHRTCWCVPANCTLLMHIKQRWPLFTICVQMQLQGKWKFTKFLTHYMKMGAHYYEKPDVPPRYSSVWMTSYIRHMKMDTHHYECADASSRQSAI